MATAFTYADSTFGSPTFKHDGDLSGADAAGDPSDGAGTSLQFSSSHLTISSVPERES